MLAYIFWFIGMAGISALQHRCSDGSESYGAAFFATPSVLPAVSCVATAKDCVHGNRCLTTATDPFIN